ncbi:MAG: Holliday junction resolvase RuvX [Candidatus Buchananbacteria bacterium CG10_big_fil_rev_8_21_14_0_10_42_9]|uniref:Putative pre-16S rRNA nuclease n=1 Tax=Candidatus Buchananbacteria bacterium CG10_big_fil_rev_8_21_14_0_10_42_9 TaxID=1974526 RepID=A0A2H0W221_9BACT|nr:MAG: Holliday junction resolvase RuvX [Candidatus Buchananbacteria bacterium CG10_big_fil_rev_8_21_14_0_10_42_9]
MNLLGVDYGLKKVGIAKATDAIALPLQIIENGSVESVVDAISHLCETERIGKVVVGLPISMSGDKKRAVSLEYKKFVDALSKALPVPVETIDERLTTQAAKRLMQSAGQKDKGQDDAVAAMTLLQNYIDQTG